MTAYPDQKQVYISKQLHAKLKSLAVARGTKLGLLVEHLMTMGLNEFQSQNQVAAKPRKTYIKATRKKKGEKPFDSEIGLSATTELPHWEHLELGLPEIPDLD